MQNKLSSFKRYWHHQITTIILILITLSLFYTDKIWLNLSQKLSHTQTTCLKFKHDTDIKEFTYTYILYYLGKEIFQRQKRLSIEKTPLNIKVYGHTQPFPLSYIGMGGGNIEITFGHHGECYTLSNISVAK
ncbi:hypothetical protein [Acinetobacter defluvii]|uniref:hypothetical protein n=1 Tax=Acinetobacter defluvii TaxID=1871111 RepID=UPI003AF90775